MVQFYYVRSSFAFIVKPIYPTEMSKKHLQLQQQSTSNRTHLCDGIYDSFKFGRLYIKCILRYVKVIMHISRYVGPLHFATLLFTNIYGLLAKNYLPSKGHSNNRWHFLVLL